MALMTKPNPPITLREKAHVLQAIRELHKAQDTIRKQIVASKKDVAVQVLLTDRSSRLQMIIEELETYLER